jgi:hypothetical protein
MYLDARRYPKGSGNAFIPRLRRRALLAMSSGHAVRHLVQGIGTAKAARHTQERSPAYPLSAA